MLQAISPKHLKLNEIPEQHRVVIEIENLSEKCRDLEKRVDKFEQSQRQDRSILSRLIVLLVVIAVFTIDYWIVIFYNYSYDRVKSGLPTPYQAGNISTLTTMTDVTENSE